MLPDWLAERVDEQERAKLAEVFGLFADSSIDSKQLRQAAAEVEESEKRWVSDNPEQLVDPDLQERILICSVGFRPMPVILTSLIVRPTKLYLLHSVESRRVAEQIRDDPFVQSLGLHPERDIIQRSISLTSAPENYDQLRRILAENKDASFVVDISGGVKVMGISLAAAAFWLRIPVVYQLGEEVNGTVRPFSAKLIKLENPFEFFGSTELRSIQGLFHSSDYDAAYALCDNLRDGIGDVSTLGRLDVLQDFIALYRDWDAFGHSRLENDSARKLAGRLRAVHGKMLRLHLSFTGEESILQNISFLEKIESAWEPNQRSMNDRFRLIDIYASSLRRAAAGKYDDAVGRLYRCLEMSASICLAEDCRFGDPKQPNLSFFVELYKNEQDFLAIFEKNARYPLLPGKPLGLKDQMTLLALSNQPRHKQMAGIFSGMEKKQLVEKRNRSILAHGTVSISQDEYDQFNSSTRNVVSRVVGTEEEFGNLLQSAAHPQIAIEL